MEYSTHCLCIFWLLSLHQSLLFIKELLCRSLFSLALVSALCPDWLCLRVTGSSDGHCVTELILTASSVCSRIYAASSDDRLIINTTWSHFYRIIINQAQHWNKHLQSHLTVIDQPSVFSNVALTVLLIIKMCFFVLIFLMLFLFLQDKKLRLFDPRAQPSAVQVTSCSALRLFLFLFPCYLLHCCFQVKHHTNTLDDYVWRPLFLFLTALFHLV